MSKPTRPADWKPDSALDGTFAEDKDSAGVPSNAPVSDRVPD